MLTRFSNSDSSRRCRIIASVTSATWNSSKQISRKRRAMRLPSSCERVDRALQLGELAVHLAHELVEVQPRLALQRHGVEEAVHQEALAAPDAAVHVDAARDRRPRDQLGQRVAAPRLVVGPLVLAALERVDRAQLRRVGG